MRMDAEYISVFPFFHEFIMRNRFYTVLRFSNNRVVMSCLIKEGGHQRDFFDAALRPGNDPTIVPAILHDMGCTRNNSKNTQKIFINRRLLEKHHYSRQLEKIYKGLPSFHPIRQKFPKAVFNGEKWEQIIALTLLHELVHFANNDAQLTIPNNEERGEMFEICLTEPAKLPTGEIGLTEAENSPLWGEFNNPSDPFSPIMPRVPDIGKCV